MYSDSAREQKRSRLLLHSKESLPETVLVNILHRAASLYRCTSRNDSASGKGAYYQRDILDAIPDASAKGWWCLVGHGIVGVGGGDKGWCQKIRFTAKR